MIGLPTAKRLNFWGQADYKDEAAAEALVKILKERLSPWRFTVYGSGHDTVAFS
jgi:hypothetical protein